MNILIKKIKLFFTPYRYKIGDLVNYRGVKSKIIKRAKAYRVFQPGIYYVLECSPDFGYSESLIDEWGNK